MEEVTFEDHSWEPEETSSHGTSMKRKYQEEPIDLPDPQLIKIHAALAGVLNLSGAAELFEILDPPPGSDSPAVAAEDGDAFMNFVVKHPGSELSPEIALRESGEAYLDDTTTLA